MDLLQAIEKRVSTRSFTGGDLSEAALARLEGLAGSTVPGVRMAVLDGVNGRVGTYGVVSKATASIALLTDGSRRAMFEAGRLGERAVLELTAMGYGSCWLGGTFSASDVVRKLAPAPGEHVLAVIVAGCRSDKPTLRDRLFRAVAHSRVRKPFDELSIIDGGERWRQALEAVRLAPSARNLQPWRAVATEDRVDFYYVETGRFAMLDMGIACTHFEVAACMDLELFRADGCRGFEGASYLYSARPKAGSSVVM